MHFFGRVFFSSIVVFTTRVRVRQAGHKSVQQINSIHYKMSCKDQDKKAVAIHTACIKTDCEGPTTGTDRQ